MSIGSSHGPDAHHKFNGDLGRRIKTPWWDATAAVRVAFRRSRAAVPSLPGSSRRQNQAIPAISPGSSSSGRNGRGSFLPGPLQRTGGEGGRQFADHSECPLTAIILADDPIWNSGSVRPRSKQSAREIPSVMTNCCSIGTPRSVQWCGERQRAALSDD